MQLLVAGALRNLGADEMAAAMIVEAGGTPQLEALLGSPDKFVRANAAGALANMRVARQSAPTVLPTTREAGRNEGAEVRSGSCARDCLIYVAAHSEYSHLAACVRRGQPR
jgi:hypothetical protein